MYVLKYFPLDFDFLEHSFLSISVRQGLTARPYVERIQEQAQFMLAEYDRSFFPSKIARNGQLIIALHNLQKLDVSIATLLFPRVTELDNMISTLVSGSL